MWLLALAAAAAGSPPLVHVAYDVGGAVGEDPPPPSIVAGKLPEKKVLGVPASAPPEAVVRSSSGDAPEETKVQKVGKIILRDLTEERGERWGNPVYPDELPSWSAFAEAIGTLSHECDPQQPTLACGTELVCRNGLCAACMHDSECVDKHRCQREVDGRNICVPRQLFDAFGASDFWLSVCVFFCTLLSAASGVGGGGMFVPLFLLFLDMKPSDAVPLSQSLILFSAVINLAFFVFQRNPACTSRPKIDYDAVMLLEPGLAAGVVIGVLLNQISPRWLVTVLLVITLGLSFARTSQKALSLWKAESKAEPAGGKSPAKTEVKEEGWLDLKLFDENSALGLMAQYRVQIGTIVVVWLCTFLSNFHNVKSCSWQFVIYLFAFFTAMAAITYGSALYLQTTAQQGRSKEEVDAGIKWTSTTTTLYPCVAFVAGLLGGMLGLGGGMIMAPFLVELGLHPEVIQASTALFVFLSSSLATLQFATKDQVLPEYILYYSTVAVLATLLGQTVVVAAIRRTGRASVIVMCIAAVLIVSLCMMTYLGIMGTWADYESGAYMGMDFYKLCVT